MQVQNFTATAQTRKHTFEIPYNASQLKLRRSSTVAGLDSLAAVVELITVEHNNLATRARSETFIRVPLGAAALVASFGERNPQTGNVIVPAVPIYEHKDLTNGIVTTDFTIQLTPGNALHTDGDNKLTLLLDDALVGATYELSLHENPVVMPFYNEVRSLPTLSGPVKAEIQAALFKHVVFPANSDVIFRVEVTFTNGLKYDYSLPELLREMYERGPVLGYRNTVGEGTIFLPSTVKPVFHAQNCDLVAVDTRNISLLTLHTDGSIVPVVTFGVNALGN